MAKARRFNGHNRVLGLLTPTDAEFFRPFLEPVELPHRRILEMPDKRIDHAYFFERGAASVVGDGKQDGVAVEVGFIGAEGMSGTAITLGNHRSPTKTYMQMPGHGLRIKAADLRTAIAERPTIHAALLKFVQSLLVQTGQTAIANSRGTIDQRLARWVLMAHDRVENDELPLTHNFLSTMLGVRRAGITTALNILQQQQLIDAKRGRILVLDRKGLETMAGLFYGRPEAELKRLYG